MIMLLVNKKYFFLPLLIAGLLWGCRSIPETKKTYPVPKPSTLAILDNPESQKKIMLAFAEAYPDKIAGVEFLDYDWTMIVNGKRFYFANGRFLHEELRKEWEQYYPWDFYVYPWTGTAGERQAAFDNPVYSVGSSFLFDTLYESPTEDDSWELQEKYSFLGVKMLVHPYIKPKLNRVSERILKAALSNPSINEWISGLQTSPPSFAWNWRTIAGTSRRSNHSYGTSIDLLPRDLKGRLTYWKWTAGLSSNTGNTVNQDIYYMPPDAVIEAFESNGFIWGGKWDLIDTMHFEYRPEILLLNKY